MSLRLRLPERRHLAVVFGALAVLLGTAVVPAHAQGQYNLATYEIQNIHSGQCLEIADWRTDAGAPARIWSCTGGDNQSWLFTNV